MTDKLLKISQRLIKWDTDFPVNSHNGYSGLKELDAIIAEAKVAVHEAGASYEDDFGQNPSPSPNSRASILEEAAKVAETGDYYGEFQTAGDERRAKAIAERIRALATTSREPKEGQISE